MVNAAVPRFATMSSAGVDGLARRFGGVVPGSGTGDIVSATMPAGSFILNREAMRAVQHSDAAVTAQIPRAALETVQHVIGSAMPPPPQGSRQDDRTMPPMQQFPMIRQRSSTGTQWHQAGGTVNGNGGKTEIHHHHYHKMEFSNNVFRSKEDATEIMNAVRKYMRDIYGGNGR